MTTTVDDVTAAASTGGGPGTRRDHGFHPLRVAHVVLETPDSRSFVLEVPEELRGAYRYRPGQFCTFRVRVDGQEHLRSYSMSSDPETDDLTVTVKRVVGGVVSNWLIDNVGVGDLLETTLPAGVFCLQDDERPVVAFCGGSGITPVMSLTRSGLARSGRRFALLYANRSPGSVIFLDALAQLQLQHPERLTVRYHADSEHGLITTRAIRAFAEVQGLDSHFYLCGPGPFMELVETVLLDLQVPSQRIHVERFGTPGQAPAAPPPPAPAGADVVPNTVTIVLKGQQHEVTYVRGDTVLETARRAALAPPFSCEAGNCATCMAQLREGCAQMAVNNALTDDEVEEGWILTCQAVVSGPTVVVEYEDL